jgi:hypothetical protein
MTGDYTRDTFRPDRRYSGVRHQQGRVQMDADINEQLDIEHHIERTTGVDVIGPTGMPEAAPGFLITPAPASPGTDLLIGDGRAYVNGVLVEHSAHTATLTRIVDAALNTVWELSGGPRLEVGQWVAQASDLTNLAAVSALEANGPGGKQRFKLDKVYPAGPSKPVQIFVSAKVQPNLPSPVWSQANGTYLAYLDVWEREITALEDPAIADVALGGPDTAVRSQVLWQVKFLNLAALQASGQVGTPPMCKSFGPGWSPLGPRTTLKAWADATAADENPCELPAQGGYRSLENHLYRVEIHRGGAPAGGQVLIKWSRDNAIHRSHLTAVENGSLVVEDIGKDDATAFATDDWVEVRDEGRILRGEPGFFVEIDEVVGTRLGIRTILDPVTQLPITLNNKPNPAVLPTKGLVRRWEGGKPVAVPAGDIALERGVKVSIADGEALVGDYWLIPARSLTAGVEWPTDPSTGDPVAQPPKGIDHGFAPLALVTKSAAGWSVLDDCRNIFPPLTKLESFFYLGGDGQEVMPDLTAGGAAAFAKLEAPLRVGVARGRTPVKGKPVRFRVTDGAPNGKLSLLPGTPPGDVLQNTDGQIVLRTNAQGVAEVAFSISKARQANHVTAEMLNASDWNQADVLHLPIQFTSTLSVASQVAYDPQGCAYQNTATITPGQAKTVQQAIDKLCPRLEFLPLGGDDQTLCAGLPAPGPLTVGVFWGKQPMAGLEVFFEVTKGDASVSPNPAVTNAQGLASTILTAGTDVLEDGGVIRIQAKVASPIGSSPDTLAFGARFLNAKCLYVDKDVCPPGQKQMESNTVADLLKYLCGKTGGKDPGFHVTAISTVKTVGGPKVRPLRPNQVIDAEVLAEGLRFDVDAEIDPEAIVISTEGQVITRRLIGHVAIDLPFPTGQQDTFTWWLKSDGRGPFFGWQTIKLLGYFELVDPDLKIWNRLDKVYVLPDSLAKPIARKPAVTETKATKPTTTAKAARVTPAITAIRATDTVINTNNKAFAKLANFDELNILIGDRPELELKLGYSALEWTPDKVTQTWLRDVFATALSRLGLPGVDYRMPAEAVLHGNRIYTKAEKGEEVLYLDGDLYVEPDSEPRYPTGDDRRGGDLVLPFFVGAHFVGKP